MAFEMERERETKYNCNYWRSHTTNNCNNKKYVRYAQKWISLYQVIYPKCDYAGSQYRKFINVANTYLAFHTI